MKISGDDKHRARLRRIRGPAARREVGKAIYVAADYNSTEASLSITAGSVSGKYHVPSKPGEPPNADTQVLSRSIHTEPVNQLKAISVADAPYAAPLETGTSKMAARPYMGPAAVKTKPRARKLVDAAISKVIGA